MHNRITDALYEERFLDNATIANTTYVDGKIVRTLILSDGRFQARTYLGTQDPGGKEVKTCGLAADANRVHDEAVRVWSDVPP